LRRENLAISSAIKNFIDASEGLTSAIKARDAAEKNFKEASRILKLKRDISKAEFEAACDAYKKEEKK
jgi:hypothetical protein